MPFKPEAHNKERLKVRAKHREIQRGSSQQRGYDQKWRAYSKERLKQHPLCEMCHQQGYIVQAKVTDHIKPAWKYPELFDSSDNHQSLCQACNKRKSQADDQLYGRTR